MMNNLLLARINDLLKSNPDAIAFIRAYTDYIHAIDDIIDEQEKREDPQFIVKTFGLACKVFSMPFYRKYADQLVLVDQLINNEYADSLVWESCTGWKRNHADAMRHCGYNMFFAVVWIVAGYEKLREISLEFREHSHLKHIHDYDIPKTYAVPQNSEGKC